MKKRRDKALLTPEVMERLSQEGYCFDVEHEGKIEEARKEAEAVRAKFEMALEVERSGFKEKEDRLTKEINALKKEVRGLNHELAGLRESPGISESVLKEYEGWSVHKFGPLGIALYVALIHQKFKESGAFFHLLISPDKNYLAAEASSMAVDTQFSGSPSRKILDILSKR